MGRAVIGLHKWLADKDNFFYGQLTLVQYFHQGRENLSPASLRRMATIVLPDSNILNIRPLSHSNRSPLWRLCIIYTLSKPAAWLAEAFPATAPNTPQAGGLRG